MKKAFLLISMLLALTSCRRENPHVVIKTELGEIMVELYPEKAPVTVANFQRYILEDRLKDATFYRVVRLDNQPYRKEKIEVVQGGLFDDYHPAMLPPIIHETTNLTGIKHLDGTISMARNEPGTATSEFFICIGDQPSLDYGGDRNPDGQGYAAFGRVIEGMNIIRQIQQLPDTNQYLVDRVKIDGFNLND